MAVKMNVNPLVPTKTVAINLNRKETSLYFFYNPTISSALLHLMSLL
jgi:hypothetical protein